MRIIITIILALTLLHCRIKPEVIPNSPKQSSAIVFELVIPKTLMGHFYPEKVFLLKLDKSKKNLSELPLIETNFFSQRRYYVLNIEPGEYAIVAAHVHEKDARTQKDANVYYVLDRQNLEKSKFSVKPNQIMILGKYIVDFNKTELGTDLDMDNVGESIVGSFKTSLTAKIGAAIISTVLTGGADQTDSSGYAGFIETNQTKEMVEEIKKQTKLDLEETAWSSIPLE
ncbi:hypothetical protein ND861_13205 [Leptospira sp. 2 VSF19]|uniref:Lipoprotein n=1 Tax=Leptospira soteropolitanensis TaxID=2950025 RepID=A0AAW5VF95_9LEPT|nr:hypothetical protein [Leptospira soteropolitanensis]MCW7493601.1 hypothetical protein [Leptospira soteropolitanensis]MCW7501200.1 hypothetical protein [Leptospira soteropolitanensis]MCW7523614.1 hypothetical protein [Leptospira soteropolitanensis]MCW7527313.1 hypothetical protein [Leptospira soteropolitanensis]MCW7531170.1 hypothetical protein [Leptospira soteropolitanensis]